MKKLFTRIILALLIPLLFIAAISYYADPGEIFHDNSKTISQILQNHQNVALNLIPANWSGIQIEMVKSFKKNNTTPQTVIWGNSRSAEITQTTLQAKSFFNHVLPGANILDYVALLGLYEQESSLPETIILTIDPLLFYPNKANGEFFIQDPNTKILQPRKGLEIYCKKGLILLDSTLTLQKNFPISELPPSFSYKLKMLLMPDYFQTALRSIGKPSVTAITDTQKDGYFILRQDGGYSLTNPEWINDTQVSARADKFFKATKGIYFCDACIKNEYYQLFKTLLIYLSQKQKRNIILFFSPIHPTAYQQFTKTESILLETETKRFDDSLQIAYIGSYNPYLFNLDKTSKAFIDEIHLSQSAMQTLFVQKLP